LASLALLATGYFENVPWLMILSVFIPLAAALFWVRHERKPSGTATGGKDPNETIHGQAPAGSNGSANLHANGHAVPHQNGANGSIPNAAEIDLNELASFDNGAVPGHHHDLSGWFDKKWFTIDIVPTYGDTNSVGNVYFASYVGWVGKARELFFRNCMPNFDLNNSSYFILTRNFNHKFARETKEFEALTVRLKIESFNRKFVKLRHEIRDRMNQMIGEGEQTLMFVESNEYRLIDIPSDVYTAFIPHA